MGNPGKPGVKWFNKFLKDYDLIPKYLRKLGAVYGAVAQEAKNMAHAYTNVYVIHLITILLLCKITL